MWSYTLQFTRIAIRFYSQEKVRMSGRRPRAELLYDNKERVRVGGKRPRAESGSGNNQLQPLVQVFYKLIYTD